MFGNFARSFIQLMNDAETLADFGDQTFTDKNNAAGLLIQGIDNAGNVVPFTDAQLATVQEMYEQARTISDFARKGGKASVLTAIRRYIRGPAR